MQTDPSNDPPKLACPCCGTVYRLDANPDQITQIQQWKTGTQAARALAGLRSGNRVYSPQAREKARAKMNALNAQRSARRQPAK